MTYDDILARTERKLRDFVNFTWYENEIRDYINDGYREFAMLTHCLRKHGQIIVSTNTSLYDVPSDNQIIYRTEWNGRICPIRTTEEMDKIYGGHDWRNTEGDNVLYVIQDGEGYPQIRTYPVITDSDKIGHLITGTDSNVYRCIVNHTSANANKPITGDDYTDYWESYSGSGTAGTWATSTDYYKYLELELDYIYVPTELPVVVLGTDASTKYKCILDHTAVTATNKPTTGSGYSTYWSSYSGNKSADTWANGAVYAGYTYDIPAIYHRALIEYALSECQHAEVQSARDKPMSDIHYDKFIQYVRQCKIEVARGFIVDKSPRVYSRTFI